MRLFRILLPLMLLLGLVAFAACGDDDDDDAPEATTPAATAAEQTTAAATPTEAPEPFKVRYGITSTVAVYWYVFIGQDEGIFEAHNVDLEEVATQTGAAADLTLLLAADEVDIAAVLPDPPISAVSKGSTDLKVFNQVAPLTYTLVTRSDITSVDQFAGEKLSIATSSPTAAITVLIKDMLGSRGITEDQYDLVVVGGTTERLAALQAGTVDAALLIQPADFTAQDAGFNVVLTSTEVSPWYGIGEWTTPGFLEENCDGIRRLVESYADIQDWFDDPANKDRAIEILMDRAGAEQTVAERTYDLYTERGGLSGLEDPTEQITNTIDLLIEIGTITDGQVTPDGLIDTTCVD